MKPVSPSLLLILLIAVALVAVIPASAASSAEASVGDSLTRGGKFTVTITGLPKTPYYIWLPRTFTMTGEPYDQPPIIAGYTQGLQQDSEGGPYTIGSYQYYNGNGRTILDDVCPSSSTISNTNYYGKVTTDENGQAVVEFSTSVYTGLRSYSVRVENPNLVDGDRLMLDITVKSRKAPSISVETATTTRKSTTVTTLVTTVTTPPETVVTTTPETLPPATLQKTTTVPTTKSPAGLPVLFLALFAAAAVAGLRR